MKFPTDRPVKVVMLGAGGTGGYVAPYVFRLLHMLDRPARFVVCDGDIVEPKNLDRQNFVPADLGENKARVLAERYSTVLGMETEYVPNFIEKLPDLMELIEPKEWELNPYSTKRTKEMVLLLGCVDNNKTRQLCHQAFHQSEELIYIDSGNGKYTGQVVCGVRRNGRTIRKSIGGVHPEMLKDTDLFPSEISCAEAAQEDPQSKLISPFGVVLGCQEPELFLTLLLTGQQTQQEAVAFHAAAMIKKADMDNAQKAGDSLICPVVVDGSDPELMIHALWHISLQKGAPLPDCGIYYAALGRAVASQEEQRAILENPAGYALCVVRLSPEVEKR